MNKIYMLLLVLTWTVADTGAQSLKQYKAEAAKASQSKDFARSLEFYNKIINQANDKTAENYYNAAESARQFRIYTLAEQYYKEVLKDTVANNQYRMTSYHLGMVLKSQGNYEEAISSFKRFIDRDAAFVSEKYSENAEKQIQDCEWAKTTTDSGAMIHHLDSTINTPNAEFAPIEFENLLYYTSVRYTTSNKYDPVPPLSRIYTSDMSNQGIAVDNDFNKGENLHSGNVAFNDKKDRIYYTVCKNINVTDMHCKIYFRDKAGKQWGPVDSLSTVINSDEFTATQPSLGVDGETGKEILFFVSDRPVDTSDTSRDLNIWYSFMDDDGNWGTPNYIAEINTDEEDITPFFHTTTQTLYFSSNGLRNLGGFDIYSIQKSGSGWGEIKGLEPPVNTSYDEVYYTVNSEGSSAYFSSNRPGGSCDPQDSLCVCNDIYRVPQICLEVRTFNKLSGLPLTGTEVALDETGAEAPVTQSKENDHTYSFFVGFEKEYEIDGAKSGKWISDSKPFSTIGSKGGKCDTLDLYLEPQVDVDVYTYDKISGNPLPGCKVSVSLVDDAGREVKQDSTSSMYNFPLRFGKKYKIVATKEGYSTDISYRTVTDNIEFAPATLRDELRLCELPQPPDSIRLYFANDEPGPRTRRDTLANKGYGKLHRSYLGSRSLFYKNNPYLGRDTVDEFFSKIDEGLFKLRNFTSDLSTYLEMLDEGQTLTVILRGFASPLGPADEGSYNYAISKRRIDSIRKYFKNNLPPEEYAKLRVVSVPNGDTQAPPSVPKTGLQAIFGLDSSEERRVEIIAIRLSPGACIDLKSIPTETY